MSSLLNHRTGSVCIVGAGVIGLSIAYHLGEAGVKDIVVLEKAGIGAGASAIQPGGVRQQWGSRVNCRLARESYAFYREVSERLRLPVSASLDAGGYVFVALLAETYERLERNRVIQNECGVPSVALTPDELGALVPGLDSSSLVGGFFCEQDGYFDRPQAVVAGFAASAQDRGAELRIVEVDRVVRDGAGWSVVAVDGRIATSCDHVVIAAGYDSPGLVRALGLSLPIDKVPRHLFYSDPISDRLLEPLVVSPDQHFAAKQLADGSVLASDLSAAGPGDRLPEWRARVRTGIESLLPILEYVSFPVHVEGHYDQTPDSQALLGAVDGHEGLWLATGLSGRGFMMAPAIGRIIADAIADARFDETLALLNLHRFAGDGVTPEPQVV